MDKPVDNLSRNLDSSIKEDVKDIEYLNQDLNLPPDYLVNPRDEVVQKSGQVSKNLDRNNGWHDVIDHLLENKLERLGVFRKFMARWLKLCDRRLDAGTSQRVG